MASITQRRAEISSELVSYLQNPRLVLVTTLDAETKWPTNNLITWITAMDPGRLRLVADKGGRVLTNIAADNRVVLTVITPGACHAIEGIAKVIQEQLEGIPLQLSMAELKVQAIREITFYGGEVTAAPQFRVTYEEERRQHLDSSVFAAMRA